MPKINTYGKFKSLGKSKFKKQIILCHTSRTFEDYLASISFRLNGNYNRIPNYVISRNGEILKLLPDLNYTNFFSEEKINTNSIIVSLENLGWLERKPLTNDYINWNGSIYSEEVYEKKWRDYFFWQPYTTPQINSLFELCENLLENLKIVRNCIGHNTKVDGIINFEGITTRSNYDSRYTDLNPSFDFENLTKILKNEQYSQ